MDDTDYQRLADDSTRYPSIPLRAPVVRPFDRTLRYFSEPCSATTRDPRASPSTGRSAPVGEATEADRFGPVPVGVAFINLAGLASGTDHGQTGDGHRLSPKGIFASTGSGNPVLAVAVVPA
jgi:hypothetical protein